MLDAVYTKQCKKDIKLLKRQGKQRQKLDEVIEQLQNNKPLAAKYRDHNLVGNWNNCRECHIEPDWLLIYQVDKKNNILYLMRTGSHSNLLNEDLNLSITDLNTILEQYI